MQKNLFPSVSIVMYLICFFASNILILAIGCSKAAQSPHGAHLNYKKADLDLVAAEVASEYKPMGEDVEQALFDSKPARSMAKSKATQENSSVKKPIDLHRKIIYNTRIELVVEDYQTFESKLPHLVNSIGGFVANNSTDRRYNDSQYGTWIVRIPVTQYHEFLEGVTTLGFAESRKEQAQDVTEEFVDVEARIKNKKQLEDRILKMLDERSGKLADVLEIERELSRVREEIERMEGRIRLLKDRTSLATVTINCREEKEYVPAAAPTVVSRIGDSWSKSVQSLQAFGANLLVGAVGLAPWILSGLIIGLHALAVRRIRLFSRSISTNE